jgi:hypothetical protein
VNAPMAAECRWVVLLPGPTRLHASAPIQRQDLPMRLVLGPGVAAAFASGRVEVVPPKQPDDEVGTGQASRSSGRRLPPDDARRRAAAQLASARSALSRSLSTRANIATAPSENGKQKPELAPAVTGREVRRRGPAPGPTTSRGGCWLSGSTTRVEWSRFHVPTAP